MKGEEGGRLGGTPSNTLAVTKPTKAPAIQQTKLDQGEGLLAGTQDCSNVGSQPIRLWSSGSKAGQKKEAELLPNRGKEGKNGVPIQGKEGKDGLLIQGKEEKEGKEGKGKGILGGMVDRKSGKQELYLRVEREQKVEQRLSKEEEEEKEMRKKKKRLRSNGNQAGILQLKQIPKKYHTVYKLLVNRSQYQSQYILYVQDVLSICFK